MIVYRSCLLQRSKQKGGSKRAVDSLPKYGHQDAPIPDNFSEFLVAHGNGSNLRRDYWHLLKEWLRVQASDFKLLISDGGRCSQGDDAREFQISKMMRFEIQNQEFALLFLDIRWVQTIQKLSQNTTALCLLGILKKRSVSR